MVCTGYGTPADELCGRSFEGNECLCSCELIRVIRADFASYDSIIIAVSEGKDGTARQLILLEADAFGRTHRTLIS